MRTVNNSWTNENLRELYYMVGDEGYEKASQLFNLKKKSIHAVFYRHDLPHINWAKYRKIRNLTEVDRAYIAGIIDGEVHISVKYGRIKITNTDKKLLDWLRDKLGGSISNVKRYKVSYKKLYSHELSKMGAVILMKSILPYLIIKKETACKFLEIYDTEKKSSN